MDVGSYLASSVRLGGSIGTAGLGETVSERAGVFNVGLEGLMLAGCFGAAAGAQASGSAWLGVVVGTAAGLALGLVLGVLVAAFRADQIVAGIGFNLLVLGTTSFLRDEVLGSQATPPSPGRLRELAIPVLSDIPVIGVLFEQSPLIYLMVLLAVGISLLLRYTGPGLMIDAVGDRASAAFALGIPVVRTRVATVGFAGLCAGLAGAYLTLVQAGGVFVDNMTAGRGYLAIAVAIFGRWRPLWVLAAAILFGAAEALQFEGQALGLEIPTALLLMFPFLLALAAWVLLGRSESAPGDFGKAFVRGRG